MRDAELMSDLAAMLLADGEPRYWVEWRTAWALRAAGVNVDAVELWGSGAVAARLDGRVILVSRLDMESPR